ncbi:MAG: hypothetical protein HZA90_25380 [Verrucomicrobia bacterium]|nr:hypothetical protein [Verrucomicrobiota bacterium]
MKSNYPNLLAAAVLTVSALPCFAIQNLRVAVQGTNAVLSWPSRAGETYLVQYRATLEPSSPWVTLTNNLPPAAGTNWTSFIHRGIVEPGQSGSGGGGGSGDPPAPGGDSMMTQSTTGWAAMTAEQRTAWRAEQARRSKAAIEYLTATLHAAVVKAQAEREQWIREGKPPRRSLAQASTQIMETESDSSQSAPCVGFYRVVKTGVSFFGVTNGTVLSGRVTLPVEIGFTSGLTLAALYATSGSDPAQRHSRARPGVRGTGERPAASRLGHDSGSEWDPSSELGRGPR